MTLMNNLYATKKTESAGFYELFIILWLVYLYNVISSISHQQLR